MTLGQPGEIAPVLSGGGARISHIMDHDAVDPIHGGSRPGPVVYRQQLFFHPRRVLLRYRHLDRCRLPAEDKGGCQRRYD